MNKIKQFFWKIRYAIYFGDKLKLKWSDSWSYAGASLENINFDMEECPYDMADDDIDVMRQDCDTGEII